MNAIPTPARIGKEVRRGDGSQGSGLGPRGEVRKRIAGLWTQLWGSQHLLDQKGDRGKESEDKQAGGLG